MRIATIDIGTNSVLLTVAERNEAGVFTALHEDAQITRIGQGLGQSQMFVPEAMDRTVVVLQAYANKCQELKVDQIIAVGTAAFRRAFNAKDFVAQVKQSTDLSIEIIPGEREAELSYKAAQRDFGDDLLVIDIGGGSTEFIWPGESQLNAISLPIGSVVLHERLVNSDPINTADFAALQTYIMTELLNLQGSAWGGSAAAMPEHERPEKLVALAGTATTLSAMKQKLEVYSHAEVHGSVLTIEDLEGQVDLLRKTPLAEKKQIPGIEPARADVVLEGAVLLHETMKLFGYDEVTISDRGVRWGLIYEL